MKDTTILSWNVQGIKSGRMNSTPFKKVLPVLEGSQFDIICLQEMCDAAEKLTETAVLKGYHAFIPQKNSASDARTTGYNHNVILSRHPIENVVEIPFSGKFPGTKGIPFENVTRADIRVNGTVLRVYNCHLEMNGVGIATRLAQLETILLDARSWVGSTIVCGDMNAMLTSGRLSRNIIRWWNHIPEEEMYVDGKFNKEDERVLFSRRHEMHGFMDHLKLQIPTWSPFKTTLWEIFNLKLDWFMTKNLAVVEVRLGDYVSDHRPVIAKIELT
jgi:endonuclease/exonuclease/phosphatase family metal-dependent hydrolase